jgi:hypothetical protein
MPPIKGLINPESRDKMVMVSLVLIMLLTIGIVIYSAFMIDRHKIEVRLFFRDIKNFFKGKKVIVQPEPQIDP